jgi:predicted DNA-binding transcriptional regulator YafY
MISVRADAPKDLEHSKNTIKVLMEATGEEVKVKMQYFSVHSQQKKTYTIHPYRLMYFRGGLYLFAYVEQYDQIRTFAVERIESIEKTREEFEKPRDFSVESYLESAFGVVKEDPFDVEIIFNADIAEYVRSRVWHPSQQVREIGGGRVRAGFLDSEFRAFCRGCIAGKASAARGSRTGARPGQLPH